MPDSGRSALTHKLSRFLNFSDDDLQTLLELEANQQSFPAHVELVSVGVHRPDCFVLRNGWAACYKLLPDGRRQIINFALPGDFLGLRSFLLRTSDHSVTTITGVNVSRFAQTRILDIIERRPRLGAAILWSVSREEAIVVEHLVNIGRRRAIEAMAHLLLELGARLKLVGRAGNGDFDVPLSQEELADALGLTSVHVNRVLRQLRERGLATLSRRRVTIHDLAGLTEVAGFSADYLDHMMIGR